jgi:hypothetical protein
MSNSMQYPGQAPSTAHTNAWRIETADDTGCGVTIEHTSTGYALTVIETGEQFATAASGFDAIRAAGEYLMAYATDGLQEYHSPETGERVAVDWSATVEQGGRWSPAPRSTWTTWTTRSG